MGVSGPLVGILLPWLASMNERDGYAYFLCLLIYPWISALYFIILPRNPYRGMVWGYSKKLNGLDRTDQDARRLVDVYRSVAARLFIMSSTLKILAVFFVDAILIAFTHRSSFVWQFSVHSFTVGPIVIAYLVGSFLYVGITYSIWGFRTWAHSTAT